MTHKNASERGLEPVSPREYDEIPEFVRTAPETSEEILARWQDPQEFQNDVAAGKVIDAGIGTIGGEEVVLFFLPAPGDDDQTEYVNHFGTI